MVVASASFDFCFLLSLCLTSSSEGSAFNSQTSAGAEARRLPRLLAPKSEEAVTTVDALSKVLARKKEESDHQRRR